MPDQIDAVLDMITEHNRQLGMVSQSAGEQRLRADKLQIRLDMLIRRVEAVCEDIQSDDSPWSAEKRHNWTSLREAIREARGPDLWEQEHGRAD